MHQTHPYPSQTPAKMASADGGSTAADLAASEGDDAVVAGGADRECGGHDDGLQALNLLNMTRYARSPAPLRPPHGK